MPMLIMYYVVVLFEYCFVVSRHFMKVLLNPFLTYNKNVRHGRVLDHGDLTSAVSVLARSAAAAEL